MGPKARHIARQLKTKTRLAGFFPYAPGKYFEGGFIFEDLRPTAKDFANAAAGYLRYRRKETSAKISSALQPIQVRNRVEALRYAVRLGKTWQEVWRDGVSVEDQLKLPPLPRRYSWQKSAAFLEEGPANIPERYGLTAGEVRTYRRQVDLISGLIRELSAHPESVLRKIQRLGKPIARHEPFVATESVPRFRRWGASTLVLGGNRRVVELSQLEALLNQGKHLPADRVSRRKLSSDRIFLSASAARFRELGTQLLFHHLFFDLEVTAEYVGSVKEGYFPDVYILHDGKEVPVADLVDVSPAAREFARRLALVELEELTHLAGSAFEKGEPISLFKQYLPLSASTVDFARWLSHLSPRRARSLLRSLCKFKRPGPDTDVQPRDIVRQMLNHLDEVDFRALLSDNGVYDPMTGYDVVGLYYYWRSTVAFEARPLE
jgi:hypothetical protein